MTPTGRWSRSEPEMQQIRFHPRPAGCLLDLDLSKVEEQVLAAMSPEGAERLVQTYRENHPEIVEAWRKGRK